MMQAMQTVVGQELVWRQPKRRERHYELCLADTPVLQMFWPGRRRNLAVIAEAGGEWTVDRTGMVRPKTVVRVGEQEIAVFSGSWDGGGRLETADGRTFTWDNTNLLHTAWSWSDRTNQPILRFKGKTMTVEPWGASVPELPLLAGLSWYLNIMNNQTSGVDAAVIVATMGGAT